MAPTCSALLDHYLLSFRPKACPERSRMGGGISHYSRSIPLSRNSERCLDSARHDKTGPNNAPSAHASRAAAIRSAVSLVQHHDLHFDVLERELIMDHSQQLDGARIRHARATHLDSSRFLRQFGM